MYREVSFEKPMICDKRTNGPETMVTIIGPRKVLGTTPGKSRWSY